MGRRGRRRKQLQDGLKETRGYWKHKKEELDRDKAKSDGKTRKKT